MAHILLLFDAKVDCVEGALAWLLSINGAVHENEDASALRRLSHKDASINAIRIFVICR